MKIWGIKARILLDLSAHLTISVIGALFIYSKTQNITYALIFILGGIFIDLDHLVDYFMAYGCKEFNIRRFFNCTFIKNGKVYVFLHSWELVFLFLIVGLAGKLTGLIILAIAFSAHILIDSLQKKKPLVYFLAYRLFKNFDTNILLPKYQRQND